MDFKVVSDYQPKGDQPQAIQKLAQGIIDGDRFQTLLGVTGSGKTFTVANVIQEVQRPLWSWLTTKPWQHNFIPNSNNFFQTMR